MNLFIFHDLSQIFFYNYFKPEYQPAYLFTSLMIIEVARGAVIGNMLGEVFSSCYLNSLIFFVCHLFADYFGRCYSQHSFCYLFSNISTNTPQIYGLLSRRTRYHYTNLYHTPAIRVYNKR